MLNSSLRALSSVSIEQIIQTALDLGELSPGAEAQVQRQLLAGTIGERDRALIDLLQDALQSGYIRRVAH
jgi:hypothetical protein